ncbi:MAG TPA: hypothetical protein PKE58_11285, partial [Acidobacteriota bacterium]|nr:hypothetical protein [Acidobacteriota bacterium]
AWGLGLGAWGFFERFILQPNFFSPELASLQPLALSPIFFSPSSSARLLQPDILQPVFFSPKSSAQK